MAVTNDAGQTSTVGTFMRFMMVTVVNEVERIVLVATTSVNVNVLVGPLVRMSVSPCKELEMEGCCKPSGSVEISLVAAELCGLDELLETTGEREILLKSAVMVAVIDTARGWVRTALEVGAQDLQVLLQS